MTLGVVLALASRSTLRKMVVIRKDGRHLQPTMGLFAHGYEHSIVNMFGSPPGCSFTLRYHWAGGGCSQLPITLGNVCQVSCLHDYCLHHLLDVSPAK